MDKIPIIKKSINLLETNKAAIIIITLFLPSLVYYLLVDVESRPFDSSGVNLVTKYALNGPTPTTNTHSTRAQKEKKNGEKKL